jgi:hypothetical protein
MSSLKYFYGTRTVSAEGQLEGGLRLSYAHHGRCEHQLYTPLPFFSASSMASQPPPCPQPPVSRVIMPISPTPAEVFALQTENACVEIRSFHAQVENVERIIKQRGRKIHGLRWPVANWGPEKKEDFAFTAFTGRAHRDCGKTTQSYLKKSCMRRYVIFAPSPSTVPFLMGLDHRRFTVVRITWRAACRMWS